MGYLLQTFKIVSVTFAIAAVATGAQAVFDPVGFSRSFGLPVHTTMTTSKYTGKNDDDALQPGKKAEPVNDRDFTQSYISLMGIRQLGTGLILLTFAVQKKWEEMATILAIIGIVVAGTDGLYLAQGGTVKQGMFHAIPGAAISLLAGSVLYSKH